MAYINGNEILFSPQLHIDGYEEGRKAEYDAFWDDVQQNGNRTDYNNAFGGIGWNDYTFKPKYKITPTSTNSYQMFAYTGISEISFDKVDMSRATYLQYTFFRSDHLHTIEIDVATCLNLNMVWQYCSNLTRLYLKNLSANCAINAAFTGCTSLTDLEIEGTIGKNGLDVSHCTKLSHESIMNIFSALSQETYGLKAVFSRAAVDKAFETSEGANDGSTNENSDWIGITTGFRENWIYELV